jgi:plastocyanin
MPSLPRSVALPVAGLALLGAACSGPEARGDVTAGPADGEAIAITAHDNDFGPGTIEVPAGEPVTLEVANEGSAPHNFVIDDLDISSGTLDDGDVVTISLTAPEGTIEFVCTFHGGMRGEIVAT